MKGFPSDYRDPNSDEYQIIHYYRGVSEQIEGSDACNMNLCFGESCLRFGSDDVVIDGGYGALIEKISEGLPILVNCFVTQIDWNNDIIRVTCNNGRIFYGKKCILTVPLGILKKEKITFNPPLPTWKTNAINKIGFGIVNKVSLYFLFQCT